MARRPLDVMKAVEHEIAAQKASNLGRMADKLEASLKQLEALAAELAAATAEARAELVAAFNAERQKAYDAYWSLCLQREAMGVYQHDELARLYPIPPKRK